MVKRGLTFFLNGSGESLFFTLRRAAAFSIFCRPEHVAFRVCQICNHTRCPRLFTGCLVSTFQLTSDACSGFYFPSIGVFLTSHPGDYICIWVEWFRFTRVILNRRFTSFALWSGPSPCAVVFICPPFLQVLRGKGAAYAKPCPRELIQQEKGFQPAR